MAKQLTDLQRYVLLGAQARLQQLAEETANIYRTFPQLRGRNSSTPITAALTSGESRQRADEEVLGGETWWKSGNRNDQLGLGCEDYQDRSTSSQAWTPH